MKPKKLIIILAAVVIIIATGFLIYWFTREEKPKQRQVGPITEEQFNQALALGTPKDKEETPAQNVFKYAQELGYKKFISANINERENGINTVYGKYLNESKNDTMMVIRDVTNKYSIAYLAQIKSVGENLYFNVFDRKTNITLDLKEIVANGVSDPTIPVNNSSNKNTGFINLIRPAYAQLNPLFFEFTSGSITTWVSLSEVDYYCLILELSQTVSESLTSDDCQECLGDNREKCDDCYEEICNDLSDKIYDVLSEGECQNTSGYDLSMVSISISPPAPIENQEITFAIDAAKTQDLYAYIFEGFLEIRNYSDELIYGPATCTGYTPEFNCTISTSLPQGWYWASFTIEKVYREGEIWETSTVLVEEPTYNNTLWVYLPPIEPNPPNNPNSMTLYLFNDTPNEVEVWWQRYEGNDFGSFEVYRSTRSNFTADRLNLIGIYRDRSVTSHTDTTVRVGTTYYYKVKICDVANDCYFSDEASITPSSNAGQTNQNINQATNQNVNLNTNQTVNQNVNLNTNQRVNQNTNQTTECEKPQAVINGQYSLLISNIAQFNGSESRAASGKSIATYIWQAEGQNEVSQSSHLFTISANDSFASSLGRKTIRLKVQDNTGCLSEPATFNVEIVCPALTANAGEDIVIYQYEDITLNGSGSSGPFTIYKWTGDTRPQSLSRETTAPTIQIPGIYQPGTYNITLTVADELGCQATDQLVLKILSIPYTVQAGWNPNELKEGENATLTIKVTNTGTVTLQINSIDINWWWNNGHNPEYLAETQHIDSSSEGWQTNQVAPGQTGVIYQKNETNSGIGTWRGVITVYTNQQDLHGQVNLTIH